LYAEVRDRLFGAPGSWNLRRCPRCQLVWLDPQPVREELPKLYASYYTHAEAPSVGSEPPGVKSLIQSGILSAAFGYSASGGTLGLARAARILSRVALLRDVVGASVMWLGAAQRGRLLDVGSGSGEFLARMRSLGWDVMGVEPDRAAARIASETRGVNTFVGTLEAARFSDDTFDAITMNHVLEHLPDPLATLAECRRLLKKGGRLVLLTPNLESLGRRWLGRAWLHWDPPRHMFLFCRGTLRECIERVGLQVHDLRTTARAARTAWAVSRLLQQRGTLTGARLPPVPWPLRIEGIAFWLLEHQILRFRPAGEELVGIAVKER
jgi:SAM-dependent methyltransferase